MDSHSSTIDPHAEAARAIPWLVNGTLRDEAATSLREHLAACPGCQANYETEKRLYEAMRAEGPLVFAGEPSFQKLMTRIEGAERLPSEDPAQSLVRSSTPPLGQRRRGSSRVSTAVRWLAAAVLVESAGLGLFAWRWHPSSETSSAHYVTLASPARTYGASARVRVMFRSNLSLHDLAKLLQAVGAHIVDGPTDANVYTLGFTDQVSSTDQLDARLAALRAQSAVLFAEPASSDGAP